MSIRGRGVISKAPFENEKISFRKYHFARHRLRPRKNLFQKIPFRQEGVKHDNNSTKASESMSTLTVFTDCFRYDRFS